MILVTHQVGYLYDCDEVIVMEEGRVKAKGSPSKLKDHLKELSEVFKEEDEEREPTKT